MEFFEKAHIVKSESSKSRKLTEHKKKQLKQMLFGYKVNDNKLIQKSTELQNEYDDSTSVSGYSDLNLTNSSNENENSTFISNIDTSSILDTKEVVPDSSLEEKNSEDSYSECSASGNSNELVDNACSVNESKDKLSFSEELTSACKADIDSSESNNSVCKDFEDETDLDSGTDSDTSIVMTGLNLSDSDISEFDADRQLAARIQERLQIKNNEQMHKNKYSIVLEGNDILKSPICEERFNKTKTQKVLPLIERESSTQRKNNKRKHKDKCFTLNKNDVERGPITKERCIEIQAEKALQVSKDELTLIKNNKQKHRDKYTIILGKKQKRKQKYNAALDDVNPVGPVNIERISQQGVNKLLSVSEDDRSTNGYEISYDILNDEEYNDDELDDDEQNDSIDSVMSPAYVSITASDMSTQRLDDIIGEYKHSTVRNLPSENSNIFSSNNSGFFVEENTNTVIDMEDDVSSLIPELDDIPKLEDLDEELIDLDTTKEITNKTMDTSYTLESEVSDKEPSIDYENVADTFKIYYGTNCCIITLKHPSKLFIQGKVKIRSLAGTLELFGYTLNNGSHNIYAPYYNFAQCIKTVENENVYFGLFGKLTAVGLTVSEAEDIVTKIGEHDGVVLLKRLKVKEMDFVENNFRITNMFKWNKTIEPYFSKVCNLLDCSLFSSRPYKSFHEHPSWREAHELAMNKYSRGIVCGGKGAGKSTYMRYQVNKLLSQGPVLVVDLDPGQCLFTVAGNLSATVVKTPLLGPTFTHLRKPELMLNIGMINTIDNAKLYATAVRTLITYCQNNKAFSYMPWLVNTMGMTISLGLKFITLIITLLQPTYVLQYEAQAVNLRFETLLTPTNVKDLFEEYRNDRLFENVTYSEDMDYSFVVAHDTDSPHTTKRMFIMRPKDERYLNFLAYFSKLLVTSRGESLLGITPYEVSLKDLRIATNVVVKKEHIAKVLNGKLVALCQHAGDRALFTLTDKPLLCRGHGLIRGIDWEKEMLYMITPVPSYVLGGVDTLVYADWAPELLWHESQLPLGTVLPYRTSTEDKQLMSTPRRRFNNPLQLLKMAGGVPN